MNIIRVSLSQNNFESTPQNKTKNKINSIMKVIVGHQMNG